jgi:plasmid stabilization system protein ParE
MATRDMRDIEEFIARDSSLYAVAFVNRLVEVTRELAQFPRMGRVVPEFKREQLREVIYRTYRIVYVLTDEEVVILRVVHSARDLRRVLGSEPWELQ